MSDVARKGRSSRRRQPVEVAIEPGACSLCEVAHPDTTPSACTSWARLRYRWLLDELTRLHARLFGEQARS